MCHNLLFCLVGSIHYFLPTLTWVVQNTGVNAALEYYQYSLIHCMACGEPNKRHNRLNHYVVNLIVNK